MRPMRSLLAQTAVFICCLTVLCVWGRQVQSSTSVTEGTAPCLVRKGDTLGDLKITQVTFAGSYKLSLAAQRMRNRQGMEGL